MMYFVYFLYFIYFIFLYFLFIFIYFYDIFYVIYVFLPKSIKLLYSLLQNMKMMIFFVQYKIS